MYPDPPIACCRCGMAHKGHSLSAMNASDQGAKPGYRCAVAMDQGKALGGFGSTVADFQQADVAPEAGLSQTTGFLCDGCFEALDEVGLLTIAPRTVGAQPTILFEGLFDELPDARMDGILDFIRKVLP